MMKLFKFKTLEINRLIAPEISFENDMIKIRSESNGYTVGKLLSEIVEINGGKEYMFSADVKTEGECEIRFILNFLNIDGKSLLRYYADDGKRVNAPENAKKMYVEIVVHSYGSYVAEISNNDIRYVGDVKKKNVNLVAVHIDSDQDVQTTCEENLRKALYGIDKAAKSNPDLIVLTECFYDRRTWLKRQETAVEMESEPVKALINKAKEHNCYIATSLNVVQDGKYYNRGILIDRSGEICGIYDKTHITMGEREAGVIPGREAKVFETDFGKVAFAICWDLWFPDLIHEYYKKGVTVLINPTAGYPDRQMRARAIDYGMYIVSSTIMSRIRTRIINPLGDVIADAEVNGYACATVEPDKRIEEYWLSVGDTYGEGRNIYINEENRFLIKE